MNTSKEDFKTYSVFVSYTVKGKTYEKIVSLQNDRDYGFDLAGVIPSNADNVHQYYLAPEIESIIEKILEEFQEDDSSFSLIRSVHCQTYFTIRSDNEAYTFDIYDNKITVRCCVPKHLQGTSADYGRKTPGIGLGLKREKGFRADIVRRLKQESLQYVTHLQEKYNRQQIDNSNRLKTLADLAEFGVTLSNRHSEDPQGNIYCSLSGVYEIGLDHRGEEMSIRTGYISVASMKKILRIMKQEKTLEKKKELKQEIDSVQSEIKTLQDELKNSLTHSEDKKSFQHKLSIAKGKLKTLQSSLKSL